MTTGKNYDHQHGRTRVHFLFPALVTMIACTAIIITALTVLADPAPEMKITALGSNQFSITITNASNPTNYTLYWTPVLVDPNYSWQVLGVSSIGETNFSVDAATWPSGWFKVMVGVDQDGDGIPEWMDAQPLNSNVGALSVTIDSPLNGSSIQ